MMRDTIVLAFRQAHLFRSTSADGTGDLLLKAVLTSQRVLPNQSNWEWEYRRELIARHELVERITNRTVWTNTIRSVAGSTALGGAKRATESSASAVRENVKTLVQVAAEQWPRSQSDSAPAPRSTP